MPKFGLRWQPFDDSLTVRATWGEGFHEPSLLELAGTTQRFLTALPDPVTQTFVDDVPVTLRSNRNLQPEDSRAFSGGIVYTPKFAAGLTLSIDLYDIESTGRVIEPFDGSVVARAANGQSLPGEIVFRDADGNLLSIEKTYVNGGSQKARGVDFGLQYQIQTAFGTFSSLTQASFLDSFQFSFLPGETERELRSGGFFGSDESHLKWRGNSQLAWDWHDLDVNLTAHYLDGFHEKFFKNDGSSSIHYVKQTWFFDVQGSYLFHFAAAAQANAVAGYSKSAPESPSGKDETHQEIVATVNSGTPCWKNLVNNTTVTIGC